MHARLNYVDLKPDRFDEADAFWREMVESYQGLVRAYFLRDADTAHTLSVVLFESDAAMRDNTGGQLVEVVRRAAALRLGEPRLMHLEVCAEVAPAGDGDIGYARVADVTLKVDRLDDVIRGWPADVSAYRKEDGFRGALLCADRATGECRSVSFWRSRADTEQNESSGAFQATVDPYRDMIAVAPTRSYWGVRVVVER